MTTFFIADTHFGDAHIMRHRGDRYPTIGAHDEALIALWNETVAPDDTVWHLGDFASDATADYCAAVFARLSGVKRLVRGNHDTNRVIALPWTSVSESERVTIADASGAECRLFLSHYAHRAWPGLWRGTRHLYGHSHAVLPDTRGSCDVGVDAWDGRPNTIDAIIARQAAARDLPEELALAEIRRARRAAEAAARESAAG